MYSSTTDQLLRQSEGPSKRTDKLSPSSIALQWFPIPWNACTDTNEDTHNGLHEPVMQLEPIE